MNLCITEAIKEDFKINFNKPGGYILVPHGCTVQQVADEISRLILKEKNRYHEIWE